MKANDVFFIVANDGTDPIVGTFSSLPDGAFVTAPGGQAFFITYDANSTTRALDGGNDIALIAIPEPGITGLLLLGSALFLRRGRRS